MGTRISQLIAADVRKDRELIVEVPKSRRGNVVVRAVDYDMIESLGITIDSASARRVAHAILGTEPGGSES